MCPSVKNSRIQRGWCKTPNRKATSGGHCRTQWRYVALHEERDLFMSVPLPNAYWCFRLSTCNRLFSLLLRSNCRNLHSDRAPHHFFKLASKESILTSMRWKMNSKMNSAAGEETFRSENWIRGSPGPRTRSSASAAVWIYFCLYQTFVFLKKYTVAPTTLAGRQTTVFTQTEGK